MLEESQIEFFEDKNKMVIQVKTENLDSEILSNIIKEKDKIKSKGQTNIDFKIDTKEFYMYNCLYGNPDFFKKAFVYNIGLDNPSSGWKNQSICMTTQKLGFIITPMHNKVARNLVRIFFATLLINKHETYLELANFNKGIIELILICKMK